MEDQSVVLNDGFLLAALLRSDSVVSVLQRELKQLYPDMEFTPDDIRSVLCQEVFQERLMNDALLMQADLRLATALAGTQLETQSAAQPAQYEYDAQSNEANRRRSTGTFKAAPSKDAEQHVQDMWEDKIQASGGG